MSGQQSHESLRTPIAIIPGLIVGLCTIAFLVAIASPATSSADDISLPADHGYVLIRITMNARMAIPDRDGIVFKKYDTGETFSIRVRTPHVAGVNAYLSMASVAEGHYFCEHYLPWLSSPKPCRRMNQNSPLSIDDIFEVKSGVVNYVGDWDVTARLRENRTDRFSEMGVTYDISTIEKAKAHFPEHLGQFETFVSYKGKQATSLKDLAELWNQPSDSDDE